MRRGRCDSAVWSIFFRLPPFAAVLDVQLAASKIDSLPPSVLVYANGCACLWKTVWRLCYQGTCNYVLFRNYALLVGANLPLDEAYWT